MHSDENVFIISDFMAQEKKKLEPLNPRKLSSQAVKSSPARPRSKVVKSQIKKRNCKQTTEASKIKGKRLGVKNCTEQRAKSMCSESIKNGNCSHVKEFLKKIKDLCQVSRKKASK